MRDRQWIEIAASVLNRDFDLSAAQARTAAEGLLAVEKQLAGAQSIPDPFKAVHAHMNIAKSLNSSATDL